MSELKIRTGDWVVICDGRKALLTVNSGDERNLNLKVIEEHESPQPKTSELGTDRPGRVQQSMGGNGPGHGGSRSSVSQTDWHDQAEREFLRTIAERVNRGAVSGEIKGLILAAPPRALGALRPLLSHAATAILHASLDKDYVNLPVYEIEKRLAKAYSANAIPEELVIARMVR